MYIVENDCELKDNFINDSNDKYQFNNINLRNQVCIQINDDRYKLLYEQFKTRDLPKPYLYFGVIGKDVPEEEQSKCRYGTSVCGTLNSHYNVIYYAKKYNLPYIIVYEDDCYARHNSYDILKNALTNIPKNSGVLMLGWTVIWGNIFYKINDYWLNSYSGMTCGGHAYIIFENSYDYVLNKIDGYNQSDNALNLNPNNTNGLITCFTDKDHRCFIQKIYKDANSQKFGNKEKIDNNDFIYSDRFNTWDIFHNNLPEYWEN